MENKFLVKGALNLVSTKFNTLINGRPDPDVVSFRVSQCKSCPLLNDRVCDPNVLKSEDGDTIDIINADKYINVTDSFGVIRLVIDNNKVYYRGCGCPILNADGTPNKPNHYFEESELEKKDGTGPCPMGRWNKTLFEQYIKKQDELNRINS
jgi:hypothetical protein